MMEYSSTCKLLASAEIEISSILYLTGVELSLRWVQTIGEQEK